MWILKRLCNPEKTFNIITSKGSYSVGRKNGDIVLDGDTSISRHHCTIKIAKRDDCPFTVDTPTGIWVIDEGSKYGTFIKEKEWVKLDPNVVTKLQNNVAVRFGVLENMYRVEFKPIYVCTSMVSDEQKEEFKKYLSLIDGRLLNDFDKNCSLLVVNNVTLTKKVLLALIYGVPIVTPGYLKQLVTSIRNQTPKPECKDFKPDIHEAALTASLVSLDPKNTRKELFKGKIFMVPTKRQFDSWKDVIVGAGGKIEFLRDDSNLDQLGGDNIVIVKHSGSVTPDIVNSYKKNLATYKMKFGKRIIPENEIPQAIAYSSIEQFCNPKYLNFGVRRGSEEMSRGEIIEGETQNLTELSEGRGFVPNSSQSESDNSQSQSRLGVAARKRDHSPDILGSAKKRALDETNSKTPDSVQFRVPAPKKQTSLLSFMSAKDKSVEKPESLNSPVSQSILRTTNNKLDDYQEMPNRPAKRKAYDEEVTAKKIEPTMKKSRVSTDMFTSMEEPSTSTKNIPNVPAKKNLPVENNKGPNLKSDKDSSSNSSSYSHSTVEDDDDDEKWITCKQKLEPNDEVEDLNTTVVLLSLVSPIYTKENGTVAEPPSELRNVKRFKKQRLLAPTYRIVPIDINDDDDDDWSGAFSKSSQVH